MDDIEKQFQKETGIKHPTIEELSSRSMLVYTDKFNKWLKSKIKNLSERSEPPTRCCAVLATPKFRIEKRQRDNYIWIEKENGEGTEISYDEFDKNFEILFNNIM